MCVPRAQWSCVLSGLLLAAAAPLAAGDMTGNCRLANQPAATLLVPYFEVDLNDPSGRTTLVSVNNAAPRPTLARMVLWTDWGIPTLAFDVYLTGYDVQTFNLRDAFNGQPPAPHPAPARARRRAPAGATAAAGGKLGRAGGPVGVGGQGRE